MPYPEILDPADPQTEILNTETAMRLLALFVLKRSTHGVPEVDELEAALRATNTYLPMPMDELEERQQQFVTAHSPELDSLQHLTKPKKLKVNEALALCLHVTRLSRELPREYGFGHKLGRELLYNGLRKYNVRLPIPIDDLADEADFTAFCQPNKKFSRPTQAIVLSKKVIGVVVRSEALPDAQRAWRAYVDVGEVNPDGPKAPLREIMYGYDGEDPNYPGLKDGSVVIAALPGARLLRPDGRKSKLRVRSWSNFGIVSNGMLCSKREACDQPLMHYVQHKGWEQDTVLTLRKQYAAAKGAAILTVLETKEPQKNSPVLVIQTRGGGNFFQSYIT